MNEDLLERLKKEFNDFFLKAKEEAKEELDFSTAYELVVKSEIVDTFDYDIYLNSEKIKALLDFKGNLLDFLYNEWIDFDAINLRECLQPSIEYSIQELEKRGE